MGLIWTRVNKYRTNGQVWERQTCSRGQQWHRPQPVGQAHTQDLGETLASTLKSISKQGLEPRVWKRERRLTKKLVPRKDPRNMPAGALTCLPLAWLRQES